jgi:heavy metal translocating P-type ATPase
MVKWLRSHREGAFFGVAALGLLSGLGCRLAGSAGLADGVWLVVTVLGLVASTAATVIAVHRRRASVDVIALLALAGALVVGEVFAGAVITLMLASGTLLEARAAARARRELSLLVERAPRTARRHDGDTLRTVAVDQVLRGDLLLVGAGEIVPVDGRLQAPGVFDESALTGEAMPVERPAGDDVRSGVVNLAQPVDLVATAPAADSTYAGVVRLVEQAQASTAPFVRSADRFAVFFVPLTLALAGAAWLLSGDPVRAVAVLVVATPCPLLLAAPIAIMSGLSRAARIGVVIKGGGALERLAAGRVMLFDKTGTLTQGRPVVTDVVTAPTMSADELLRLAASLDQVSAHVLAGPIVAAARRRGLVIDLPDAVNEQHGYGVEGTVGGRSVRLGKAAWIVPGTQPAWVRQVRRRAALDGSLTVFAAVDGVPAGAFLLEDPVRPDAPRMIRALRQAGITRTVLITGDRADTAETVARITGVDAVHADHDPAEKLAVILAESRTAPTIMVGDGINDAPALAAAGVGVALAARGATASSEAADVVLTVDRIDALADAIMISRRARRIAVQSSMIGMGLSLVAMIAAAAGLLAPAVGALLQEVIDVAAIASALRALRPIARHNPTLPPADRDLAVRLRDEHASLRPVVEDVRAVADTLTSRPGTSGQVQVDLEPARALLAHLQTQVVPHERAEQDQLYPAVARALGGADPIGAMSRSHAEIEHQVSRLARLLTDIGAAAPEPEDVVELCRLLYGLYAVLRLHNAQEDEWAFSLLPDTPAPVAARGRAPRAPASTPV